jgi:hypothetical protein
MDLPDGYARAGELQAAAATVLELRDLEALRGRPAEVPAPAQGSATAAELAFGEGHIGPTLPGEVEAVREANGELPLGDVRRTREA